MKPEDTAAERTRSGPWRFSAFFLLYCGVFYLISLAIADTALLDPFNRLTARMVGSLLTLFHLNPLVHGTVLSLRGFSVQVVGECSPLFTIVLIVAFILAYPASPRQKLGGLAMGIPILTAVNLMRIAAVFLLGAFHRPLFEPFHIYFGQVLMVMVTLMISLIWVRSAAQGRAEDSPGRFFGRFLLCSIIAFLFWLYLGDTYLDLLRAALSALTDSFIPALGTDAQPSGVIFNMVTFTGLVLATGHLRVRQKIRGLFFGWAVLTLAHTMLLACHTLVAGYGFIPALLGVWTLLILNQRVLPFLLWLLLVRRDIFSKNTPPKAAGGKSRGLPSAGGVPAS